MSEPKNPNFFLDFTLNESLAVMHPRLRELFFAIIAKKKPNPHLFSNNVNYRYYMRYVHPKICAKNHVASLFGQNAEKIYSKYIMIAPDYVVITVNVDIGVEHRYFGEQHYYSNYTYVIGIDNTNSKIFVNRAESWLPDTTEQLKLSDFVIMRINNKHVYRLLGYEFDCDNDDTVVYITKDGTYRIQGEIAIQVTSVDDIKKQLFEIISPSVADYMSMLTLDVVYGATLELGYSANIRNREGDYELWIELPNDLDSLTSFREQLAKQLSKYFARVRLSNYYVEVEDPKYGHFKLLITISNIPDRIIIKHYEYLKVGEIAINVLNELKNAINNTTPQEYKFCIGEHKITVQNACSLRASYSPTIQPIWLNDLTLSSSLDEFLVDNNSMIIVTHLEHGERILKFNKPLQISFTTTSVHPRFNFERNKVVFSLLNKTLRRSM